MLVITRLSCLVVYLNYLFFLLLFANVKVKEMGGRSRPVDAVKVTEQSTEKKKGLGDWMNIIKPANEEKDHWVSICQPVQFCHCCLGNCFCYAFVYLLCHKSCAEFS